MSSVRYLTFFCFTLGGSLIVVFMVALSSFVGVTIFVGASLFVGVVSLFVAMETCVAFRTGGNEASLLFLVGMVVNVGCESCAALET